MGSGIPDSRKVIVIGAGAAGLSCAHSLHRRGVDVRILETAAQSGGRMLGQVVDGFHVSTGAMFFGTAHQTARGLADEMGVPTGSLRLSGSIGQYTRGESRPTTNANLLLMRLYSPKAIQQAAKLLTKLATRRKDFSAPGHERLLDLDADGETFADYLLRHGGHELLVQIGDSLSRVMAMAGPDRIGAVFGLRSLWGLVGNPSQEIFNPDKGIGSFAAALSRACAKFTCLSLPVEQVVLENGKVKGVVTRNGFREAAAVVCATTAKSALRIVPNLPLALYGPLSKVTYSSCCHVVLGVDGQCLPKGTCMTAFPKSAGFSLACLAEATNASPGAAPVGKGLVHAHFAEEFSQELFPMSDEEIVERAIGEIRRAVPDMPDSAPFARVHRWKEAVCLSPGGTLSAMHRLRTERFNGTRGFFLAGEYMGVPGIESSLRSGVEAAESVAKYLGQTACKDGTSRLPSSGSPSIDPTGAQ